MQRAQQARRCSWSKAQLAQQTRKPAYSTITKVEVKTRKPSYTTTTEAAVTTVSVPVMNLRILRAVTANPEVEVKTACDPYTDPRLFRAASPARTSRSR